MLRSYPTYEEWKLFQFYVTYKHRYFVLILPMRNGNEVVQSLKAAVYICSYPTYEEWKPSVSNSQMLLEKSSYPTYEEWKRLSYTFLFHSYFCISSYPTYEEWKLQKIGLSKTHLRLVLILPMRNGNSDI